MPRKREITVSPKKPIPPGYAFLAKGNQYKTLHCRRLTHEAGKPLYVVEDNRKVIGIRVPKAIFFQVQALARETLEARRTATEQRDATQLGQAATELRKQFPKIPKEEQNMILKHGFRKHSGRVGRTGLIPLPKKVLFAVIAHIRHRHTEYEQLLKKGEDRDTARRAIAQETQIILRNWGSKEDYTWYFQDSDQHSEPTEPSDDE